MTTSNQDAIIIRKLRISEVVRVAELERLCNPMPWSAEDLRRFASDVNSTDTTGPRHIALVAGFKTPDEIAGYACASMVGEEGEILVFGVDPDHRRRGLGRALLMESGRALKALGCRSIFLEVRHENEAAVALYRSAGFIETGLRKGYYADTVGDARMMRWDLATFY